MNAEDQYRFMQSIREYAAKYPGDVTDIVNAAHQGVQDRLKETTERAANMGSCVSVITEPPTEDTLRFYRLYSFYLERQVFYSLGRHNISLSKTC